MHTVYSVTSGINVCFCKVSKLIFFCDSMKVLCLTERDIIPKAACEICSASSIQEPMRRVSDVSDRSDRRSWIKSRNHVNDFSHPGICGFGLENDVKERTMVR